MKHQYHNCNTCKLKERCDVMDQFVPQNQWLVRQTILYTGCYHWRYPGDINEDIKNLVDDLAKLPTQDAMKILMESRPK